MTINIFLITYWILTSCALIMAGIIIYHIWAYSLNKKAASLTIFIFCLFFFALLLASIWIVIEIDWSNYLLIL
ncbi:MAG: hypothetical protein ACOCUF_03425 [Patescibacteria group bacterium]